MSLFRLAEWYSANFPSASCIAVGQLIAGREQCLVGCEDGLLTVLDPGGTEKTTDSQLLQHPTGTPIVQIAIGRFLTRSENSIAVLSTKSLAFFALRYDENDTSQTALQPITQHDIQEGTFNMCLLDTGTGNDQLLVQTLSCRLALYQGDQCIFSRTPLPALHPGPLAYHHSAQSLIIASGSALHSIKFSLLYGLGTSGKKVTFDWSLNLGDWPLSICAVDSGHPLQPSIVVLTRRALTCVTTGGNVRWQLRLECIGTALMVYRSDDTSYVRSVVATNTNTLLIFTDHRLAWNCQMDQLAVQVCRGSFTPVYENLLAVLTREGQMVLGYLGTEPSLYKVHQENRIIDFKAKMEDLKQLEASLKGTTVTNGVQETSDVFAITYSIKDFERPQATGSRAEPPCCIVNLRFEGVDVEEKTILNVNGTVHSQVTRVNSDGAEISFSVGKQLPVSSKVQVAAHCNGSQATALCEIRLPLSVCFVDTSPERNAKYKLVVETDAAVVGLNDLYKDYNIENPASLGLQVYNSDATVSIFTASKSNRYRIQSDRAELIYVILDDLVDRLKKRDPGVSLSAHLPMEYVLPKVEQYLEIEAEILRLRSDVEKKSQLLRGVQALLIGRAKGSKPDSAEHLEMLYEVTHAELSSLIDRLINCQQESATTLVSLRSLFDLAALVCRLSNADSALDGRFYTNTQQTLRERLSWAAGIETDPSRMVEMLCKHTAKNLPEIAEGNEDEDDEADDHVRLQPSHVPI